MINKIVPKSLLKKIKNIKSLRPIFIEEVTNMKKKDWQELTLIEKAKVNTKCHIYYLTMHDNI